MRAEYKLDWATETPTRDEVVDAIAPLYFGVDQSEVSDGMAEEVEAIINGMERVSWDADERHLAAVSTRWPHVVFTLLSTPDDGPQYVTFCKDGLMYSEECRPPEFDQDKFDREAVPPQD